MNVEHTGEYKISGDALVQASFPEAKPLVTGGDHGSAVGGMGTRLPGDAVRVEAGDVVAIRLPASEVVMHLGLADKLMLVELTPTGGAQIRNPDNSPVSFPVHPSEAGIFTGQDGTFYTYPEPAPRPVHRTTQQPGPGHVRALPAAGRGAGPGLSHSRRSTGLR
jgi:hypothetical protein